MNPFSFHDKIMLFLFGLAIILLICASVFSTGCGDDTYIPADPVVARMKACKEACAPLSFTYAHDGAWGDETCTCHLGPPGHQ